MTGKNQGDERGVIALLQLRWARRKGKSRRRRRTKTRQKSRAANGLREDDAIRPAAQSFRLSQGFSSSVFAAAALSACFFALIPKMSAMSPPQTTAALKSPIANLPHSKSADFVVQKQHERANSHERKRKRQQHRAIARGFGSGRRGGFFLENPVFHRAQSFRLQFFNGNKLNLRDDLFVFLHFLRRAEQHMHDAKMNTADFSGIVIDQADGFSVE
jgi:hypothetical protein